MSASGSWKELVGDPGLADALEIMHALPRSLAASRLARKEAQKVTACGAVGWARGVGLIKPLT